MQDLTNSLTITVEALKQIKLMLELDYTLSDKHLRVQIAGKGCDGFTYQVGFDSPKKNDLVLSYEASPTIFLLMDPFTAFYLRSGKIDFQFILDENKEGFIVINNQEHLYEGKFYQDNNHLVPPDDFLKNN